MLNGPACKFPRKLSGKFDRYGCNSLVSLTTWKTQMNEFEELAKTLDKIATVQEEHKRRQEAEVGALKQNIERLETRLFRPGSMHHIEGNFSGEEDISLKTSDGRVLLVLNAKQAYAARVSHDDEGFSLGQFTKDAIVGSRKASSGPALIPTAVSARVVDAVRKQTVIVEAGAGTIIIEGPTNLARLTQDPTVHQHTEAATDISESDILATPVTLNPKLLVALVPLTVELVSDSPNLDAVLQTALTAAFAQKLNALCIATLLADVNIPKSAAAQDPNSWTKVLEAVSAALVLDQRLPEAHISAPADFMARAAALTTEGSWLGKPPVLSAMRELQTTGLTAGTALFGNFAEAFAIALRDELRVEVVRHAKPTSASHLLVAHMRADGIVLQPGKLFKQLKTI